MADIQSGSRARIATLGANQYGGRAVLPASPHRRKLGRAARPESKRKSSEEACPWTSQEFAERCKRSWLACQRFAPPTMASRVMRTADVTHQLQRASITYSSR